MNPGAQYPATMPLPNFNAWASILPKPLLIADKLEFIYTINYGMNLQGTALAASAAAQQASVNISNDAHFVIVGLFGRITTATPTALFNAATGAGDNVVQPVMVSLSDNSGNIWMDNAVHWDNLLTYAAKPFYLPFPRLVLKNSTITSTLTNLVAVAGQAQIALHGFKVYTEWKPDWSTRGS